MKGTQNSTNFSSACRYFQQITVEHSRSPTSNVEAQDRVLELDEDRSYIADCAQVMENIKEDFEWPYFIIGNLILDAYEKGCEFADPATSFKGLCRFTRICSNFGSLIEKSKMNLIKWEEFKDMLNREMIVDRCCGSRANIEAEEAEELLRPPAEEYSYTKMCFSNRSFSVDAARVAEPILLSLKDQLKEVDLSNIVVGKPEEYSPQTRIGV
ncbi:hypothetical protein IFM89_001019 [Coptis chinensis]|uniref:Uncharacterized protein n=1 Tax=Coptis chinensis TaxID=261450 RepID=A0A835GVM3_9MAGN|nr:hypothetical protein IFM89_001019 [Coptis chinensis]